MVDIEAQSLVDGEAVYIKSENLQNDGKAIHLESKSNLSNHVVKIDAYEVVFGNVVAVNGRDMKNGTMFHISSNDGNSLIGSPMSYRIKNIEQGTTTKVVLEDYDHGFQTGDKVKISGIGGDNDNQHVPAKIISFLQ